MNNLLAWIAGLMLAAHLAVTESQQVVEIEWSDRGDYFVVRCWTRERDTPLTMYTDWDYWQVEDVRTDKEFWFRQCGKPLKDVREAMR